MIRDESTDSRVWTSGGLNQAFYGQHRSRHQNGADRSPGSKQSEEHPYIGAISSATAGYFKWYHNTPSRAVWDYGWSNYSPTWTDPIWTSNDDLALIGKLREKVQQTKFNGGNFLGELPQTVGLLGGKLGLLANALAALGDAHKKPSQKYRKGKRVPKKGRTGKFGQARGESIKRDSLIANSWLEFSFGVLPLINDIYGLAEIASKQNEMRSRIKVSRKGTPGKYSSPWTYADCSGEKLIIKSIIMILEQETLPTFWEQFGLADPATIAWELLPWSFAVDWVLPIGKFVEAQSFARRMTGKFVLTTYELGHWHMTCNGKPSGNYLNSNMLSDAGSYHNVTRTVESSLDVPFPSLKSNLLGGKPLERIANALALIGQALR